MTEDEFHISQMTPRVKAFFLQWYVAQDRFEYMKNGKRPGDRQEDFMQNVENGLADYKKALALRDEAHPDAHLMLMLTVKGGWFARWRAEVKGAKLWKYQNQRFENEYKAYLRFYEKMHAPNTK